MPNNIEQTTRLQDILRRTLGICRNFRHEFVTPEHLLRALTDDNTFFDTLCIFCEGFDVQEDVSACLQQMEKVPKEVDCSPIPSAQLDALFEQAYGQVQSSNGRLIDIPHVVKSMLQLKDSWAAYILEEALGSRSDEFMSELISAYEEQESAEADGARQAASENWRKMVICVNDMLDRHNPLIGREAELARTVQILCRREKNNPLHVGEPGVGKTALVYGLTALIEQGRVPDRLKGARVYQLDLGSLLAGTQFRGDFEKRIKQIMDGITAEGKGIVYIDEIHNLVGAGAVGESSMDASNMLKPYLEQGNIRFIGSTTYEEYNKFFSRSKGLVRRFQQVDIQETTVDETINILKQLRPAYEAFHGVVYEDEALELAVRASDKYVNDRFLPDKAIDLIEEAGASLEMTGSSEAGVKVEGKALITEVLAKTCKVDAMTMKSDDNEKMATLFDRMAALIYGQDEAIRQVVDAVQTARAGLLDDNKPQASLLFVGPTGVGKTEVARQLARQLGIELIRFDMSEYTEKHTVAKLIGSPAGYVGYEDGGLLTDAIRKSPNCVLLLDEIEKAHQDIYNILLQVMDYARLTDNKGRKADFRNVVLIMTSNAGAQFASQASIGFNTMVSRGEAMRTQVKKIFKPEFINRLSSTVVFRDMDKTMATLILKKKLAELQEKLTAKHVVMELSDDAFALLLTQGFTPEYGAREMDRVISQLLKPLLVREILFGKFREAGGRAVVNCVDGRLKLE